MTSSDHSSSKVKGHRHYRFRHGEKPSSAAVNRVVEELKANGAARYDLWLPETNYLPNIIHADEHITGSVFGRYSNGTVGRAVLVATDQRVLFVDKKPGYLHCDELTYMIVGGVTYTWAFIFGYVTLHTRLGDFRLRTFNRKNALRFVDYVEQRCLQQPMLDEDKFDQLT